MSTMAGGIGVPPSTGSPGGGPQCTVLAFTAAHCWGVGNSGSSEPVGCTVTGTLSANVRPPDPSKVIVRVFRSPGAAVYLYGGAETVAAEALPGKNRIVARMHSAGFTYRVFQVQREDTVFLGLLASSPPVSTAAA